MPTPLFLLLHLLHIKPALRFRVSLFTADLAALRLHSLPLQLECLLGLRADPAALRLLSGIPETPLGIIRRLLRFRFDSGAEDQFVIMPQDKLLYIIILGLCAKGHFAYRQLSFVDTLKYANPEGVFKEYRQAYSHASLPTHITLLMNDP